MNRIQVHLDRAIVFVIIIVIWQGFSTGFGVYWASAPWLMLVRFFEELMSGGLLRHASYTMQEAVIGFFLGGIPAIFLPFLLRRTPRATAILDPFMVAGYGTPKLALAPLFILWFGIGIESKIALVASAVFFIVYFSTHAGIRALDTKLVQMAQIVGAAEQQVARMVIWPAAVPYIFAGLRIALPYAISGAVIAELISANRGLGYLVQVGAMNFDTTQVFVAIFATTLIVLAANTLVNICERLLLRWRPTLETKLDAHAGT